MLHSTQRHKEDRDCTDLTESIILDPATIPQEFQAKPPCVNLDTNAIFQQASERTCLYVWLIFGSSVATFFLQCWTTFVHSENKQNKLSFIYDTFFCTTVSLYISSLFRDSRIRFKSLTRLYVLKVSDHILNKAQSCVELDLVRQVLCRCRV